jgi:hypothetical protein
VVGPAKGRASARIAYSAQLAANRPAGEVRPTVHVHVLGWHRARRRRIRRRARADHAITEPGRDRWLKAGVIEKGKWSETVHGAAQGASASPLLSNVYLHYVFDLWADQWRRRHARGDVIIVRFADDYLVGFEHRDDARRFLDELRDRLARFGLELAPGKTRLIEFGRSPPGIASGAVWASRRPSSSSVSRTSARRRGAEAS